MSERERGIQQHFESEAPIFDELIVKLIPEYQAMVEALVGTIPFEAQEPIRVLDLGSGTGTVARVVADRFRRASLTCVDVAPSMIAAAREKLAAHPQTTFIVGDFATAELGGPYDALVSSLALHHLETPCDKQRMYERLYALLAPSGVLVNADVVLGGDAWLSARYLDRWAEWMAGTVGWDEVQTKWLPKHAAEDRPAPLIDHLDWMRAAGFAAVDVVWKRDNFAVFCGRHA
jgi:tRNA (cmo5U34)-methyltransferase